MKRIIVGFGILVGLVIFIGCSSPSKSEVPTTGFAWAARMQGMAKNLENLMPYVFSREEFSDPRNKEKIHNLITEFSGSVELVPKHAGEAVLGKDPLIKFSISRLNSNTSHALKAFDEGHTEFSRNVLRENMGLCFSCHTTSQFGPQSNFSKTIIKSDFRIYPSERAEYYVATRQFDRAADLLESALKSPANVLDDPHEQVESLRKFLSLEVRVKKDPAHAAAVLETFLNNQKLPYFIATDTEAWLKSLRDWQRESKKTQDPLTQAQNLLKKAKNKQSGGGYQSAYVDYLRVSMLLHESLRIAPDGEKKAKTYQLLGQSYETLSEMGTWDLPEVYFEACVRSAPRSLVAKTCYKDFEKSIILGFSGSAGIFIPKEERERMAELKSLAGL